MFVTIWTGRGPGLEGLQLFFLDCSNNLMQLIPGGYQRKKLDDIGKNLFSSNLMTSFSSKVVETMIQWVPTKLVHRTLVLPSVMCTSLVGGHCILPPSF